MRNELRGWLRRFAILRNELAVGLEDLGFDLAEHRGFFFIFAAGLMFGIRSRRWLEARAAQRKILTPVYVPPRVRFDTEGDI